MTTVQDNRRPQRMQSDGIPPWVRTVVALLTVTAALVWAFIAGYLAVQSL